MRKKNWVIKWQILEARDGLRWASWFFQSPKCPMFSYLTGLERFK